MSSVESLSIERRLQNVPAAYFSYVAKTVIPANLTVFYPLMPDPDWTRTGLGIVLVVGLTVLVLNQLQRAPWLGVGWFWFLGTLVPVIGIVQVGGQSHADRYTYVALVGVFVAVVWSIAEWVGKAVATRASFGKYGTIVVLLMCILVSRNQIQHWESGDTMFRHALKVTDDNHIAYYNLARLHMRRGEFKQAVELLRAADKILPNTPDILLNLGASLHEGRLSAPQAHAAYVAAAEAAPASPKAYNNLGNLSSELGRHAEAIKYYEQALELDPKHFDTLYNYGGTLMEMNRMADAVAVFDRALKISPRDLDARNGLITALSNSGKFIEAMGVAMETADMYPTAFEANFNAGALLQQAEHDGHAISYYRRALLINPDYLPARLTIARILSTSADEKTLNPTLALTILDEIESKLGRPDFRVLEVRALALNAMGQDALAQGIIQQAVQLAKEAGADAQAARMSKVLAQ